MDTPEIDDPNAGSRKHPIRLDNSLWNAVQARAKEMADLGVPSDRRAWMRFSMADIFRRELARVQSETLEQTMERYGIPDPRTAGAQR